MTPPTSADPVTVSPAASIIHLVVLILGAVIALLSVTKTGVAGTDASVGTASGALMALGALWKYLDTHDKALAAFVSREVAWGQAHAPALEAALADAQGLVSAVPALQADVTDVKSQVADLATKVGSATGVDVDAIAEAAKSKVVAALTAGAAPVAPPSI